MSTRSRIYALAVPLIISGLCAPASADAASVKTVSTNPGKLFSVTVPSPGSWCRLSAPGGRLTVRSRGARSIRFRFTVSRRARKGAYALKVSCSRRADVRMRVRVKSGRGTARSLVSGRVSARRIGQLPVKSAPRPAESETAPVRWSSTLDQAQTYVWNKYVYLTDLGFSQPDAKGLCSNYVWIRARSMYQRLIYAVTAYYYAAGPPAKISSADQNVDLYWKVFHLVDAGEAASPAGELAMWHRFGFEVGDVPRAGAIQVMEGHVQMIDSVRSEYDGGGNEIIRYTTASWNAIVHDASGKRVSGGRGILTIDDNMSMRMDSDRGYLYFIYP